MGLVISVQPSADGWIVGGDGLQETMTFATGSQAEAAGRQLLEELAQQGEAAELCIYLRDGSLAGRFVCPPGVLEPS